MEFSSDDFLSEETSLYGCTSVVYNESLSVVWRHADSVASSVQSLSDIFVEWYLFDSSKPKTLEEFIESESLRDVFTSEQFMGVMAGVKHIDDNLCALLSHILPFKITVERIHKLNDLIKDCTPELKCSTDFVTAKLAEINARKKQARLEWQRQYDQEHKEHKREYRHRHYVKNKARNAQIMKQYYLAHIEEIKKYNLQWCQQNAEHLKAYRAEYRKNNAAAVSERKKRAYQQKKELYNKKSRAYYSEHKEQIKQKEAQRRELYKQDNELAQRICPVFRFLMELKRNNVELFLTKFTRQGVIASKAKKRCVALQTGDWVQCSLCGGSGKDNCPIPEVFEFKNAVAEIQKHIQQIKSENQR